MVKLKDVEFVIKLGVDNFEEILNSYKWIKVKKFNPDDYSSLEDKYDAFEKHHIEETSFLIDKVRELAKIIKDGRTS